MDQMTSHPLVTVFGFDHINISTADMARALRFYTGTLGLPLVRVDRDAHGAIRFAAVRIGDALIDFQPIGDMPPPNTGGFNHVCLLVEPTDLDQLRATLEAQGVPIIEGPVRRQGAYGYGTSLYIRDPDGYGIELKHYEYPRLTDDDR
jgi:glyoxylase I family protein